MRTTDRPHLGPCRRWTTGEKGSEIVEGALVITILLTFLIGIIWIARGYNVYQTMNRAAREGARFAVLPSCATCGNAYPADSDVQAIIDAVLLSDNLDPTQVSPNPVTIQRNVVLNPGSIPLETGVVINFSYPFDLFLPFTPVQLTSLTLTTNVQMREEK
ncbi:MAG: pilus assembly protein [Acidobacteria bacterium]|nr:pilus assembly protein [Acidobacteriota bacterium]